VTFADKSCVSRFRGNNIGFRDRIIIIHIGLPQYGRKTKRSGKQRLNIRIA